MSEHTPYLTVGDLRRALRGVPNETIVYVNILEPDYPGYGGHALSAGIEDGYLVIAADEEEWEPATAEDLKRDLETEEGDGDE
jgi:hypothetical protein